MSAYRFCRTDDIPLLVEALRRCWWPHFRHEAEPTVAAFKREIRDLQIWCSSCMVAFDGADPVGVLVGAKRAQATLLHRLAVHPAHLRRGHGRHLVTSLVSKLEILGPPRIVAEVPEDLHAVRALLAACGFSEETVLTNYLLAAAPMVSGRSGGDTGDGRGGRREAGKLLTIPVTVGDLEANDLIGNGPPVCWDRDLETLHATREELRGLALVGDDRIAAYALWHPAGSADGSADGAQIMTLRATGAADDAAELLALLLERVRQCCTTPIRMRRVHPDECSSPWLAVQGFRARSRVGLWARLASA